MSSGVHSGGNDIPRRTAALSAAVALAALLAGCALDGGDAAAADNGPGRLVTIADGRQINFVCKGSGSPTVLLESGFGAGSGAWYRVQPSLARTTRVCAYDRAGSGYSDPGPLPRDGAAMARDLDQTLAGAGIEGPYIVVGHSAGALYARLFAARRPGEVVALVLLDPTVERASRPGAADGLEGLRRRAGRCLDASQSQPQPPQDDARWTGCLGPKPSPHEIAVSRRSDTWRSQISELDSLFGRTSDQIFRLEGLLRDVPVYVFTASDTANAAPSVGFDTPRSVWELQHQALAAAATVGYQQTILSSHMVMFDRPEIVVATTEAIIRGARAGQAPPSLAPSETGEAPSDLFNTAPAPDPAPFASYGPSNPAMTPR